MHVVDKQVVYRVRRRQHRDIKSVLLGIGAGIVAGAIVSALIILFVEWVRRSNI